ncbi:hypothetical protein ACS0TY_017783 [Phlomoides rotata]
MRCATLGSPIDTADHRPPLPDSSRAASLSLISAITTTKPRAASYFNLKGQGSTSAQDF